MAIKKWILTFALCVSTLFFNSVLFAQNPFGQVIQINTNFRSIIGKPNWLLIIRNEETGQVFPYIFDITVQDNFWLAFTYGRTYRITASKLTFGPYAIIHNFCNLEDGMLSGKSMIITLTGDLTPATATSHCKVMRFEDAGEFSADTDN